MTFPSTQISSPPQAAAEVIVNEALATLEHQSVYGRRPAATAGLTWGYYGGRWGGASIADGTLALTASATNYVVVNRSTGAISASAASSNWDNAGAYARVYKITTGVGSVSAVEDHRAGANGVHGGGSGGAAAAYNNAAGWEAFGDSFTSGEGASAPANAYTALIAAARGWTATNHGTSGDMVADHADDVFALSVADGTQSTLLLGTNDQRHYTTNTYKQGAFKAGHMALAAWLAIPNARKVNGRAPDSSTGTWTDMSVYGSWGRQSIVGGSTITYTVYGSVVYVCSVLQNSINATFTVTIDGVVRGTYQCMPGGGATITSVNGRTYMPQLIRIPGLSEGAHTVVITVGTASTSNPVYIVWVAGNLGHATKDGPNVWVGNIHRYTPSGYSTYGGSDATVAIFNDAIRQNCETLADDGLNVALCDSGARLSPSTDLYSDGVHPDDSGHALIAAAFLEQMNQAAKPRRQLERLISTRERGLNIQAGTTYKFAIADARRHLRISNASGQTVTVPTHVEVPFELGSRLPVTAAGAGTVTIAGDGGVTVNAAGGVLTLSQYETGWLTKINASTWDFSK